MSKNMSPRVKALDYPVPRIKWKRATQLGEVMNALEAETLTWAELADALRGWAINPSQVVRDFENGTMPVVLYHTACILAWCDSHDVADRLQAIRKDVQAA